MSNLKPNKQSPKLVAIDPGASGGIAYLDRNVDAVPMPDTEEETCALLRWYSENNYKVYMEKVGGFIPDANGDGQPGSRMFVFGEGYGFIRGVLCACGNPPVLVVPQRWQRGFPKFKKKTDRKNAFKAHAQKLNPHLKVTLATADALCLLDYARAQESGEFGLAPVPAVRPNVAKASRKPPLPAAFRAGPPPSEAEAPQPDAPAPVDVEKLTRKQQVAASVAWCNAKGYEVPPRATPEFSSMFNYWYNLALNNEA